MVARDMKINMYSDSKVKVDNMYSIGIENRMFDPFQDNDLITKDLLGFLGVISIAKRDAYNSEVE